MVFRSAVVAGRPRVLGFSGSFCVLRRWRESFSGKPSYPSMAQPWSPPILPPSPVLLPRRSLFCDLPGATASSAILSPLGTAPRPAPLSGDCVLGTFRAPGCVHCESQAVCACVCWGGWVVVGGSFHRGLKQSVPPYEGLASHPGLNSDLLFLGKSPDSTSYVLICTGHLGKSVAGLNPGCPTVPCVGPAQP